MCQKNHRKIAAKVFGSARIVHALSVMLISAPARAQVTGATLSVRPSLWDGARGVTPKLHQPESR
jgi:hypothetical protein